MNFIKIFKEIRGQESLTIYRLSKNSGIHDSTLRSWESYGVMPPIDKYAQALEAMGYEIKIVKIEE